MKFLIESAINKELSPEKIRRALIASGVNIPDDDMNESARTRSRGLRRSLTERYDEDEDFELKAFITNLGKYNEGELVGQWVTFPIDESEFDAVLESIGIGDEYEEWFVTDYECGFDAYGILGEYPSYEQLNEVGEALESVGNDEHSRGAFLSILDQGYDFDEAVKVFTDGDYLFFSDVYDYGELAEILINEEGGVDNLPETELERYFDYDQLGRDLSFDSYEDDDGEYISAGEYFCNDEYASDEEIGEAYVDGVGFDGVSNPAGYFDFDSYGRDLHYDGFTITDYGIIRIL